jgi:hypothetical protein
VVIVLPIIPGFKDLTNGKRRRLCGSVEGHATGVGYGGLDNRKAEPSGYQGPLAEKHYTQFT